MVHPSTSRVARAKRSFKGSSDEQCHQRRRLSYGYVLDGWCVASEDDDEADPNADAAALAILHHSIAQARNGRVERAIGYRDLARRQRQERIERGLPSDEEDNADESVQSDEDGDSEWTDSDDSDVDENVSSDEDEGGD